MNALPAFMRSAGKRPVRTVFARPAQVAKFAAGHAAHHAGPRRRHEDQAQRGRGVLRHVEPFRRVERAPDLPDFGGGQEAVARDIGTAGRGKVGERVDGHELAPGLLGPFEHRMQDVLGLVRHRLAATPVGDVVQHRGRVVIGDRGGGPFVPAVDAADALQRLAYLVAGAERGQLGVVVERDNVGIGLSFFFSLGALDLRRERVPPAATVLRASLATSRALVSGTSG